MNREVDVKGSSHFLPKILCTFHRPGNRMKGEGT